MFVLCIENNIFPGEGGDCEDDGREEGEAAAAESGL